MNNKLSLVLNSENKLLLDILVLSFVHIFKLE